MSNASEAFVNETQVPVDRFESEQKRKEEAFGAFVEAQSSIGNIGKDAKGNYGKFVSLAKLLEAVVPALNGKGLFLSQGANYDGSVLTTSIIHKNGTVVAQSSYPISVADRSNPQKVGSGVTYARRYSLMSLIAAAGDDDDEGTLAAVPAAKPKTQSAKTELMAKLKTAGVKNADDFKKLATAQGLDVQSSKDLTEEQAASWLAKLTSDVPF